MSRANLRELIPRKLVNRPSRVRHYAVAAHHPGLNSTRTMFWCQMPPGYQMLTWELQPHRAPICIPCQGHANAVGNEDSSSSREVGR